MEKRPVKYHNIGEIEAMLGISRNQRDRGKGGERTGKGKGTGEIISYALYSTGHKM